MGRAGRDVGSAVGLRPGRESGPLATFVELFFDLVMVFALTRLVAEAVPGLSSMSLPVRWLTMGQTLLLFLPLTWVWTITSYVTARFEPLRFDVQVAVLASAFGLLMMGTAVPYAFSGRGLTFALAYVTLQVGRTLLFGLLLRGHALQSLYARACIWFCVGAVPWLAGAFAQTGGRVLLWSLAIAIDLGSARLGWPVPGMGRGRAAAWSVGGHHLADRYKQFLIIALGEGVLTIGVSYTTGSSSPSVYRTVGLILAFLTTVLLWRIYFFRAGQILPDAVTAAKDRASFGRHVAFAHLIMIFGIVATAIGYELVQRNPTRDAVPAWLAVILGGPALYVVGRARLEWAVFGRVSSPRLVGVTVLALLAVPLLFVPPLAAAGTATLVLLFIALADARRAAGRPPEPPAPVT
ncbi:low temperature requirement protein A [Micromonospora sp. IBHARD004]|uniref:low temperature requirement protein A n=1 Tax=Micromonospora sp. IBHARD004 TaxID=3457764 RepID=UPI004058B8CE